MIPNPQGPSGIPGVTRAQAVGLLYGLSGVIPGFGPAAVSIGVGVGNILRDFYGGGSSPPRHGFPPVHQN